MVLIVLLLLMIMVSALVQTVEKVMIYLPYVSGLFYGFLICYIWKPIQQIIPGHKLLSYITSIAIIETIIFILLHIEHTKRATIAILCGFAPTLFMTNFQVNADSWQMALLLTIIHILATVFLTIISIGKNKVDFMVRNGLVATIFNALSYCATVGMIIFSAFYCYWELYMNNMGKMATYTSARTMVIILAMMFSFSVPIFLYILNKSAIRRRQ